MTHIVCPHCNAVNRIPADKPAAQGKCGRCHKPLFDDRYPGRRRFFVHDPFGNRLEFFEVEPA